MPDFGGVGQKSAQESGALSGQVCGGCKVANPDTVPGDRITVFQDMSEAQRRACVDNLDPAACRSLLAASILERWRLVFNPLAADPAPDRHRARAWFGSRDFGMFCTLAGFDPAAVMEAFRVRLAIQEAAGGDLSVAGVAPGRAEQVKARREAIKGMRARGLLPPLAELCRMFDVKKHIIYNDFQVLGLSIRRDCRRAA